MRQLFEVCNKTGFKMTVVAQNPSHAEKYARVMGHILSPAKSIDNVTLERRLLGKATGLDDLLHKDLDLVYCPMINTRNEWQASGQGIFAWQLDGITWDGLCLKGNARWIRKEAEQIHREQAAHKVLRRYGRV